MTTRRYLQVHPQMDRAFAAIDAGHMTLGEIAKRDVLPKGCWSRWLGAVYHDDALVEFNWKFLPRRQRDE